MQKCSISLPPPPFSIHSLSSPSRPVAPSFLKETDWNAVRESLLKHDKFLSVFLAQPVVKLEKVEHNEQCLDSGLDHSSSLFLLSSCESAVSKIVKCFLLFS
jgi:hypothetical protein